MILEQRAFDFITLKMFIASDTQYKHFLQQLYPESKGIKHFGEQPSHFSASNFVLLTKQAEQMEQPQPNYMIVQYEPLVSPNFHDPRNYDPSLFSNNIRNTFENGIPAYGNGQFTVSKALLAWFLCCFGCSGMQRVYVGDICLGIAFCLTNGFCGWGQLIDLFLIQSVVEDQNAEIRQRVNEAHQKRMRNQQLPTDIVPANQGYIAYPPMNTDGVNPPSINAPTNQPQYTYIQPGNVPQQEGNQPPQVGYGQQSYQAVFPAPFTTSTGKQ
ncbi:MAG: hypothetical protein EZS28_024533 [Streblomastix strix]|uniref:TM2 domain-containing protein n=1 Tax=Streblomastix strix TaxID=222440 RepID=A0A5J4VBV6_9EUKA|nr:MAG: hypothetical protein EZS28_024533 [Streblomastix strix]